MERNLLFDEPDRLFDVFYSNDKGKVCSVRYCCKNEDEARRLFFSEIKKGEELQRIDEILD